MKRINTWRVFNEAREKRTVEQRKRDSEYDKRQAAARRKSEALREEIALKKEFEW